MADTSLVFDLILKGRAKVEQGLKGVGKSFRSTGSQAEDAMDKASGSTEKLDDKIEEVERSVRELNQEIAATGGTELLPKLRKQESLLRTLRKVRKSLDDVGDEAAQAGRKIGVALAGQVGGRVGAVLPKALAGVFNKLPPQVQGVIGVVGAAIGLALGTAVGAAVVAGVLLAVGGGVLATGIAGALATDVASKKISGVRDEITATKERLADLQSQFEETGDRELLPEIEREQAKLRRLKGELKGVKEELGGIAAMEAFRDLGKRGKKALSGFFEPFRAPLVRAAGTFGDALERAAPTLTRIGQAVAPLIDKLAPAMATIFERSLPGIESAVTASLPLFEIIAEHAPGIGDAISKFFSVVSAGAPGATLFLDHLLSVIEFLLPAVGMFFARLAAGYQTAVVVFAALGKGVLTFVNAVLLGFKSIIDIAAAIPGPHQAAMAKLSGAIGRGIDRVNGLKRGLDDLTRPRTAKVNVSTAAAMAKLRGLNNKIRAVVYDRTMGITVAVRGGGRITERAHGGPVHAGQPYIVGERRPELFVPETNGVIMPTLPRASNPAPMAAASGGRGGVQEHHIIITIPELKRTIRYIVGADGGGSVQRAFGT